MTLTSHVGRWRIALRPIACLALVTMSFVGCARPADPKPAAATTPAADVPATATTNAAETPPAAASDPVAAADPAPAAKTEAPMSPATAPDPQPAAETASTPTVAAAPAADPRPDWRILFDRVSLKPWTITDFGGQGEVKIEGGAVRMEQGAELTGIHWTGDKLPTVNYEVELQAQRIDGSDFFCGLVFPVKDKFCSFVVGGWGGGVVGLSSVDGLYASENDTATFQNFDDNRWYTIRLRVGENFVQAWIDGEPVVDVDLTGRDVSLHPAVSLAKPLGVCCFSTVAAVRDIRLRELSPAERTYKSIRE